MSLAAEIRKTIAWDLDAGRKAPGVTRLARLLNTTPTLIREALGQMAAGAAAPARVKPEPAKPEPVARPAPAPVAVAPEAAEAAAEIGADDAPVAAAHPRPSAPPLSRCQWPEGDPLLPGFHFCGAAVHPGKPYCPDHCAQAYRIKPKRGYAVAWTPERAAALAARA